MKLSNLFSALLVMSAGLIFSGCYALNSASTTVKVLKTGDSCQAEYSSNKEQVGLEASVCGGSVKVDKSGSNDAVIAATLAMQQQMFAFVQQMIAMFAASSGAPVVKPVPAVDPKPVPVPAQPTVIK